MKTVADSSLEEPLLIQKSFCFLSSVLPQFGDDDLCGDFSLHVLYFWENMSVNRQGGHQQVVRKVLQMKQKKTLKAF